jgi:hypothetical protein
MVNKDKSIMMALGIDPETGEYKKGAAGENLIGDLKEETKKTIGEEFDQFKQEPDISQPRGDAKLPRLTELKLASEKSGGNLGSEAGLNLMRSIESTVVVETQKVQKAIMNTFLPVEVELKKTIELLSSNQEDNQDKALERMEKLRKGMGIDFEKVAAAMGQNVQELIAQRQFLKEQRRQEKEIEKEKKENSLKVRDELREKGINTYLDKETNTLKVMTLKDEKAFKKEIISDEKRLKQLEKEYLIEEKKLKNESVITIDQQKELQNKQLLILDLEKDINKKKEEANIKPTERSRGFFSDTFGAAFDSAKNTFGELKNMGGDLIKGFKNIPSLFSSLGKGLTGAGAGLLKFGVAAAKGVGIGLVIGLVILGLLKLYLAFQRIKEKISNFFSFGKKKDTPSVNENQTITNKLGETGDSESSEIKNGVLDTSSDNVTNQYTTDKSIKNTISEENATDNLIQQERQGKGVSRIKPMIQPMPKPINVNRMSTDLMATRESKPSSNIIAPSSNNNIITNNTTQSISMTPLNTDRSFINLNTVPV